MLGQILVVDDFKATVAAKLVVQVVAQPFARFRMPDDSFVLQVAGHVASQTIHFGNHVHHIAGRLPLGLV